MREKFSEWMLKTIREENNQGFLSGWLEEERFRWNKLVYNTISYLLSGTTFLLVCDTPREWFKCYILNHLNQQKNRPLVPILDFSLLLSNNANQIQNTKDMLNIAYRDYAFFYIGKRDNPLAELAIENKKSFLWILDESIQNAFVLDSSHPMLDLRLLQLYKIFDTTLYHSIFGKLSLEE